MGAGATRILAVHVLPNVLGPLLILVSMDVPAVIAVEAGLSFLGMGVRPPTPDWGAILNDGYSSSSPAAFPSFWQRSASHFWVRRCVTSLIPNCGKTYETQRSETAALIQSPAS